METQNAQTKVAKGGQARLGTESRSRASSATILPPDIRGNGLDDYAWLQRAGIHWVPRAKQDGVRLIYVAGPYRADTAVQKIANISKAWIWARHLWQRGDVAICPHMNTLEMDGLNLTPEHMIYGDLLIISRCDAIHMLPGWEHSVGSRIEHRQATKLGIDIYLVSEEELADVAARMFRQSS